MKQLESEQQFESLKQGATVFEFTAGWCPDCRVIEPDLPELEARYPMFDFVSVDRDKLWIFVLKMVLWVFQVF